MSIETTAYLGIEVSSDSAVAGVARLREVTSAGAAAEVQVEKLSKSSQRFNTYFSQLGTTVGGVSGKLTGLATGILGRLSGFFSRAAGSSRLFALQLSQVGQMGAVTGNYLQALLIQLPDLAIGLGPVGIALGTIASVVGTIAYAMYNSKKAAKELKDSMDQLAESVEVYISASNATLVKNEELIDSYGRLRDAGLEALENIAAASKAEAVLGLNDAITQLADTLSFTGEGLIISQDGYTRFEGIVRELNDTFGLADDQAQGLLDSINSLTAAGSLEAQATAANDLARFLMSAYGSVEAMPPEISRAYSTASQLAEQAAKLNAQIEETSGWTLRLTQGLQLAASAAGAVDAAAGGIVSRLSAAVSNAWGLRDALAAAAKARNDALVERASQYQASGRGTMVPNAYDIQTAAAGEFLSTYKPPRAGGGGGGGGGGVDQSQQDLDALMEKLRTQEEIEIAQYEKDQQLLQQALDQKKLSQEEYYKAIEALNEQHQETMSGIDAYRYGDSMQKAGQFFGDMADAFAKGNEKMQRISKIFAATEALINTSRAAAQTLADPSLPFFAKFAAVAQIVGAGMSFVNAIKSGSAPSSGGRGGGGTRQPQRSQGQRPQHVIINIPKGQTMGADTLNSIFDSFYKKNKRRGNVFQVREI